ncbi:MAG: GNAT family N-acetyltransferase [Xanthobacteraceae bacterium]|nr:GNAT family N-acetyltransferase [Xanthobacteraceae bacterium]
MLQEHPIQPLRELRTVVLETERLVLRQPTLADVKAIAQIVADKRVAMNLRRVPHPYTIDDAVAFVSNVVAVEGMHFLIERKGEAIGLASLTWDKNDAPELGYCITADRWSNGYATEAARALIDFAFEEFTVDEIRSGARVVNPASRRVLEKCGFQWTGVELHRFLALGSSTPVDRFRLERGVWSSLKSWSNSRRR